MCFCPRRLLGIVTARSLILLLNFDAVGNRLAETLDLYFQQCSLLVNSHDLAVMGATLANNGVNPLTERRALSAEYIKDVLSVMYSCGMYDFSGEWGYRVGLPAKSGVGGGILAVVPQVSWASACSPRRSIREATACGGSASARTFQSGSGCMFSARLVRGRIYCGR